MSDKGEIDLQTKLESSSSLKKSNPPPCAIGGRNDGEMDFQVGISTKELRGKHQCGDCRLADSGTPALSYSSSEHTHSGTGHCPSAEVARGKGYSCPYIMELKDFH